jgi:hypothetical protein
MNDWFTPDADPAQFKSQFSRDGEDGDTDATASRQAGHISAHGADVYALVEAPSRAAELAPFVDHYHTANGAVTLSFCMVTLAAARNWPRCSNRRRPAWS